MAPDTQNPAPIAELLRMGDAARRRREWAEAERYYKEALTRAETSLPAPGKPFGRSHIQMAEVLIKLGRLYESHGKTQEAQSCFRQALEIFSQTAGDEYFDLAIARDHVDVPEPAASVHAA
ncbi:MAG: tetratricopeptide repeat protein [Bryobacteraceae bacterium]|nr:tetratricopeptide repeat protein [Bryobacteraceae bacterium]MDW8377500.1 tetratricopeptide repeat protein [Bryobacterales bacterium]